MKVNKLYWDFFDKTFKTQDILILQGSKRAGKTTAELQYIYVYSAQHPNTQSIVVTDTFTRLRDSILSDFEMINADTPSVAEIMGGNSPYIRFFNGSIISFVCASRDVRGYTSNKKFIFFNEANRYGNDIVRDVLKAGGDECKVFFDYNPYARFYVNDIYENDTNKLITTYKDNPFCPAFARKQLEMQEEIGRNSAPGTFERYIYEVECLGIDSDLSGLCFPNSEVIPDSEYDDCPCPEVLASDWGQILSSADPDVVCGFKFDGNRVLCKEYYYRNDGTDKDIAEVLKSIEFKRQWFVYETATAGEARIKNIYNESGLRFRYVPCSKGVGSVMIGIRNLQEFKICITESSMNIRNEQRNYKYITKNDIMMPADKYNHAFDCLRYAFDFYCSNKKRLQ